MEQYLSLFYTSRWHERGLIFFLLFFPLEIFGTLTWMHCIKSEATLRFYVRIIFFSCFSTLFLIKIIYNNKYIRKIYFLWWHFARECVCSPGSCRKKDRRKERKKEGKEKIFLMWLLWSRGGEASGATVHGGCNRLYWRRRSCVLQGEHTVKCRSVAYAVQGAYNVLNKKREKKKQDRKWT